MPLCHSNNIVSWLFVLSQLSSIFMQISSNIMSWTIAISHKSGIDWLNSQLFSFANPTIRFLWEKKTKTTQPKKLVWIMQLCRTWLAFCMIKKNTLEIATWGFRELNSWFDYFMISVLSDFCFQDVLLLLLFLVSYLILVFFIRTQFTGQRRPQWQEAGEFRRPGRSNQRNEQAIVS